MGKDNKKAQCADPTRKTRRAYYLGTTRQCLQCGQETKITCDGSWHIKCEEALLYLYDIQFIKLHCSFNIGLDHGSESVSTASCPVHC